MTVVAAGATTGGCDWDEKKRFISCSLFSSGTRLVTLPPAAADVTASAAKPPELMPKYKKNKINQTI